VLTLAEEVVLLVRGQVIQAGPVLEVFNRPANATAAELVGLETLVPGEVLRVDQGLATVRIGDVNLTAVAPANVCGQVFAGIRGEAVSLQRDPVISSSARNRLRVEVVSWHSAGALVRVELDAGFRLSALVTHPAAAELELCPGAVLTAVIKAPAVHLIPR
ncbi:MAG TPA: TOBE domain-containing protein, partial [Verrucomicrobiae bacterium]